MWCFSLLTWLVSLLRSVGYTLLLMTRFFRKTRRFSVTEASPWSGQPEPAESQGMRGNPPAWHQQGTTACFIAVHIVYTPQAASEFSQIAIVGKAEVCGHERILCAIQGAPENAQAQASSPILTHVSTTLEARDTNHDSITSEPLFHDLGSGPVLRCGFGDAPVRAAAVTLAWTSTFADALRHPRVAQPRNSTSASNPTELG